MTDILSAAQAAKVIGCNPQKVRQRIKSGIWSFGTVVTAKESGCLLNTYEINKKALAEFLRVPIEEINRRLTE